MDAALASKKSARKGKKTVASKKKGASAAAPTTPAPPAPVLAVEAGDSLTPGPVSRPDAADAEAPEREIAGGLLSSTHKRAADPSPLVSQPKRGRRTSAAEGAAPSSSSKGDIYQPEWELTNKDSAFDDPSSAMQLLFHTLLPRDYAVMDAASDEEVMGSAAQTLCRVSRDPFIVTHLKFYFWLYGRLIL
jgi:hypothetical protein